MKINGGPNYNLNDDANIIAVSRDDVEELALHFPGGRKEDLLPMLMDGANLNLRLVSREQLGVTDWIQIGSEEETRSWKTITASKLLRFRLDNDT